MIKFKIILSLKKENKILVCKGVVYPSERADKMRIKNVTLMTHDQQPAINDAYESLREAGRSPSHAYGTELDAGVGIGLY